MCGDQTVSGREGGASASLSPDPPASASPRLGLQRCFRPPRGGAVGTLSGPMLFSSLLGQVTVSVLAEREVCFSNPMDGANVVACVSRVVIGPLVCLGSRPVLWLSSTIGYRERGREGW